MKKRVAVTRYYDVRSYNHLDSSEKDNLDKALKELEENIFSAQYSGYYDIQVVKGKASVNIIDKGSSKGE